MFLKLYGAALVGLIATTALAHDHWIGEYKRYPGDQSGCCGKADITQIPHADAYKLHVGSKYVATFPDGNRDKVEILVIYPTEDGDSYITRWGCLFRPFGM